VLGVSSLALFTILLWNDDVLYTKDNFFQSHLCACPNPGSDFLSAYVVVRFVCNDLRREVVVRVVDIDRIVDHYCLISVYVHTGWVKGRFLDCHK
jgi:hypothetical protein